MQSVGVLPTPTELDWQLSRWVKKGAYVRVIFVLHKLISRSNDGGQIGMGQLQESLFDIRTI